MRISDWSSDVYSSDLPSGLCRLYAGLWRGRTARRRAGVDRSSGAALLVYGGVRADAAWRRLAALRGGDRSEERRVGKGVSVRVDLGGSRIIKKKNDQKKVSNTI